MSTDLCKICMWVDECEHSKENINVLMKVYNILLIKVMMNERQLKQIIIQSIF